MDSPLLLAAVVAFVVLDAIVIFFVLRRVQSMRAGPASGTDLGALRSFTRELEETTEMHVRTHWSGDPSTLPSVLEALIAHLATRAEEQGFGIERALIKRSVSQVIRARDLVPADDLRAAMRDVA